MRIGWSLGRLTGVFMIARIWRFPKVGVPSNHAKLDQWSIETCSNLGITHDLWNFHMIYLRWSFLSIQGCTWHLAPGMLCFLQRRQGGLFFCWDARAIFQKQKSELPIFPWRNAGETGGWQRMVAVSWCFATGRCGRCPRKWMERQQGSRALNVFILG